MQSDTESGEQVEMDTQTTLPRKILRALRKNLLLVCLLISLIIGVALGAGLRKVEPKFTTRDIFYLRFPGDLLMNMLKFLIVPLIISSLISGLSSLDSRASGRMGLRAVVYYLTTTFAAVILGIILVVSIQPGTRGGEPDKPEDMKERIVNTADTFLDLIRQCFPDNIVEMTFKKSITDQVLQTPKDTPTTPDHSNMTTIAANLTTVAMTTMATTNTSNIPENVTQAPEPEKIYDPVVTKIDGMNVLGIVVFSIFLGVILGRMGDRGRVLVDLFDCLCEATMRLVTLVIWYSPIGIMSLIAAKVVEMEDPEKTFEQLVYYFITVLAGLFLHGFGTLPLVYFVIVRRNPYRFMYGVLEPMVTALATSSSSATLPVTMRCLEENNGVDSRVIKFVTPVGATINMDGTALYEAVAVLFIGQMRGISMNLGQIITISITSTAAAIGAAGVPQAGLVTMVIVLSAVGFPTDDVAVILAVDWLLDRFRTSINVLGDAFGAGIVAHLSRRELRKMDRMDQEIEVNLEKEETKSRSGDGDSITKWSDLREDGDTLQRISSEKIDLSKANGEVNEGFIDNTTSRL